MAHEAGVGKGTVFRRFDSREGLMAAVLDRSETAWQAVLSGPPPLGPGAPAMERLLTFGHSRLEAQPRHGRLIRAAGRAGARSYAVVSFAAMHIRYLLGELGVRGDLALLATSLLAPLEVPILEQQTVTERWSWHGSRQGGTTSCAGSWPAEATAQRWWRRSPKVSPSTSAPHEASITLWPTPTVTHEDSPSVVSMRTRVMASVPWPWSRMRTL